MSQAKRSKPTRDDVEVNIWVERDRQHVEIRNKKSQHTVVEWWDENVSELITDGFFYSPHGVAGLRIPAEKRKFENSVLDYAESIGFLQKGESAKTQRSSSSTTKPIPNWRRF